MNGAARLEAGNLQVRFEWQEDRFRHIVGISEKDGFRLLLKSVEGTGDEHFPPSPVLTVLRMESRPGGAKAALLLGMAASNHWSASIDVDPSGRRIAFDVACRLTQSPEWLGSTYRLSPSAIPCGRDSPGDIGFGWNLDVYEPAGTPLVEQCFAGDIVTIVPRGHALDLPCTVRWRYVITRNWDGRG